MTNDDSTQAGKEFGERLVEGVFEALGIHGFNSVLDSPNAKSAKALLNYKPPAPPTTE